MRAAAVSRVRGGDARRVWLRDSGGSGGGPSSPPREETLAVRSLRLFRGLFKVTRLPQIEGRTLHQTGSLLMIILKKYFYNTDFILNLDASSLLFPSNWVMNSFR